MPGSPSSRTDPVEAVRDRLIGAFARLRANPGTRVSSVMLADAALEEFHAAGLLSPGGGDGRGTVLGDEQPAAAGACGPSPDVAAELALRLADVQAIVSSVDVSEDTGELSEDAGGLMSPLDYALRGDSGCIEPDEWQDAREAALAKHAEYLGFDHLKAAGPVRPEVAITQKEPSRVAGLDQEGGENG